MMNSVQAGEDDEAAPCEKELARARKAFGTLVRGLALSNGAIRRSVGISGAQLFVLEQLDGSAARSITELAERTGTHQSTMSLMVSRMADRGHARRARTNQDLRCQVVSITDAGRQVLAAAPRTPQSGMVELLRAAPPERVAALADALEAWLRAMGAETGDTPMFFDPADDEES